MINQMKKKELANLLYELKDKNLQMFEKLLRDPTIYIDDHKEFALIKFFAIANKVSKQDMIKLIVDFKNGKLM